MKIKNLFLIILLALIPTKAQAQMIVEIDPKSLEELSLFTCKAFNFDVPYAKVRKSVVGGILIANEHNSYVSQFTYTNTPDYIYNVIASFDDISAEAGSFEVINYAVKNYCPQYNYYRTDLNN